MKFLNKTIGVIATMIVLMLFMGNQALANPVGRDYMIIVAVGEFEKPNSLYQEMDLSIDVKTIRDSFTKNKLRPNPEIVELVNEKATKKSILNAIDTISAKLTKNDRFYFYFSGHGTSPADHTLYHKYKHKIKNKNFLNYTSAILPYDFDVNRIEETLIIGNKHFKKRIEAIDKKIEKAIIIIDACYSLNMVRKEYIPAVMIGDKKKLKNTKYYGSAGLATKQKNKPSTITKNAEKCSPKKTFDKCMKNSKSF